MKIIYEELNIYVVEAFYQEILEAYKKNDTTIDMQSVSTIDMSAIQLLISLYKSCQEASKEFQLLNVNAEVEKVLHNCACDFLLKAVNE